MNLPSDVLILASIPTWLHVSLCVLLPLVWGIATEIVFRWIAKKHPPAPEPKSHHFLIEYHI
jgi:hypothetical protein